MCFLQRPVFDNSSTLTLKRRVQLGANGLWPTLLVSNALLPALLLFQRSQFCIVSHTCSIYFSDKNITHPFFHYLLNKYHKTIEKLIKHKNKTKQNKTTCDDFNILNIIYDRNFQRSLPCRIMFIKNHISNITPWALESPH